MAISFDLHERNAAELTEAVLTERLDFAILRAPVARPQGLAFVDLGNERLVVALPVRH
jgi:DNA-binding transcriptional LysR family regulator